MGALNCLSCLEHMAFESSHHEQEPINKERLMVLQKGSKFSRTAYLGLTKQELLVRLSDDCSALQWKTENTWTKSENGEIDLTSQVKRLKVSAEHGMQLIGLDDSILIDIKAEDDQVRDQWMVTLNEMLSYWAEHPEKKPKSSVSAEGSSNKAAYFKQREAEISAREKANEDRKAKYAAGGMKYTALAMANSKT